MIPNRIFCVSLITATFCLLVLVGSSAIVFTQGTGAPNKNKPKRSTSHIDHLQEPIASKATPTPAVRLTNPNIELVKIPSGAFMMGSANGGADEKPQHQVTINYSFYIGKYEVTQAQWQAVMGNNPSKFKDCSNCPVEQVSWNDTKVFIGKLNQMNDGYTYRLPTEAEWEYACRAGTTGDYAGQLNEMAWYEKNSGSRTHAVGGKQHNAWGLADMHGNVWERCEDFFHPTYEGAPTDGSAWLSGVELKNRVVRGSSYYGKSVDLRSAYRDLAPPFFSDSLVGLRVVAVR